MYKIDMDWKKGRVNGLQKCGLVGQETLQII